MTDEVPFPPALPAVVPSPIGPAISYSNIRAVTTRAQSLLDQLDKKIRKPLIGGLDAAGQTGARIESKVLSRLADQINPVEQLHNDTVELIQNQLVANMAPAAALLEDLSTGTAYASQPQPPAAGTTMRAVASANGGSSSVVPTRTATITSQPIVRPQANLCNIPDRATVVQLNVNADAIAASTSDPGAVDLGVGYYGFDVNCCWKSTIGSLQALRSQYPPDWTECLSEVGGIDYGPGCKFVIFQLHGTAKQQAAGFAYLKKQLDPQGLGDKPGGPCGTTPIDCKTNPLDPSCPPDCKAHPEDPRCKPTDGNCPPPCIDVTCPPPIINVPPCPPINIPTCVQIDLCDWDKFCKALKDCLVKSKEDCALDNEEAYVLDDCQGQLGQAQKLFFSSAGDQITAASSVEEAVKPSTLQQNQFVQVYRVGRNMFGDLTPA
jgi:hypothetical protein